MPLFEVAIIETPTKTQVDAGEGERLVLPPTAIVAANTQAAIAKAARDAGANFDASRAQVLVRPFV